VIRGTKPIVALAIALSLASCNKEEARPAPAPSETPVRVTDKEITSAAEKLLKGPAEPATAADKAQRVDAAKFYGKWNIVHTVMLTNGEGGPTKPIMPTTWTFNKDGGLAIEGGMSISMKYIYTGDKLIMTGMGPKQEYDVVRLTDSELEVRAVISAGATRIENTTLLRR